MSHLIANEMSDGTIEIRGYAADEGETLECEGCEKETDALYETDDSVMLCKPCFDRCVEDADGDEAEI